MLSIGTNAYICIKPIHDIITNDHTTYWELELDGVEKFVDVSSFQITKHNPQIGWYYVVYEDGYVSFSPAGAFEGGYTKI